MGCPASISELEEKLKWFQKTHTRTTVEIFKKPDRKLAKGYLEAIITNRDYKNAFTTTLSLTSSEDSGEHPAVLPATAVAAIPHEAAAAVLADHLKLNIAPPFSNEEKSQPLQRALPLLEHAEMWPREQQSVSAKAVTKRKRAPAKKDGDNDKPEDKVTKAKKISR
eukprot:Sro185_g080250.2  (166) ;mRNA; r:19626-20123